MRTRIISLYFLKDNATLPEHFQLYLNSCAYNKKFEWLFVTNAAVDYDISDNVKVLTWDFMKLQRYVQKKFDFPICLENPYKLCDYKVLYGYIFSEYLEGYDFWGYCDCTDVIWGDLSHFITESHLNSYDKIYWKGHLTLYRNEERFKKCFMEYEKNGLSYKDIISQEDFFAPDETGILNISDAWKEKGYSVYLAEDDIADVGPLYFPFRKAHHIANERNAAEKNKHRIFFWDSGQLYCYSIQAGGIKKEEFAYVHFQKRDMEVNIQNLKECRKFFIIPNQFCQDGEVSIEWIRSVTRSKLFYRKYFELRAKNLKRRIYGVIRRK